VSLELIADLTTSTREAAGSGVCALVPNHAFGREPK
jgi:hypothetical protein